MTPYQKTRLALLGDGFDVQVDFARSVVFVKDMKTDEILRETAHAGPGDTLSLALERLGFPQERPYPERYTEAAQ